MTQKTLLSHKNIKTLLLNTFSKMNQKLETYKICNSKLIQLGFFYLSTLNFKFSKKIHIFWFGYK